MKREDQGVGDLLVRYGRHDDDCGGDLPTGRPTCRCGLAAALAAAREGDEHGGVGDYYRWAIRGILGALNLEPGDGPRLTDRMIAEAKGRARTALAQPRSNGPTIDTLERKVADLEDSLDDLRGERGLDTAKLETALAENERLRGELERAGRDPDGAPGARLPAGGGELVRFLRTQLAQRDEQLQRALAELHQALSTVTLRDRGVVPNINEPGRTIVIRTIQRVDINIGRPDPNVVVTFTAGPPARIDVEDEIAAEDLHLQLVGGKWNVPYTVRTP